MGFSVIAIVYNDLTIRHIGSQYRRIPCLQVNRLNLFWRLL